MSCYSIPYYTACADGYTANDGSCYKMVSEGVSGDAAQAACVTDGGNLVSIGSSAENEYILSLLEYDFCF